MELDPEQGVIIASMVHYNTSVEIDALTEKLERFSFALNRSGIPESVFC